MRVYDTPAANILNVRHRRKRRQRAQTNGGSRVPKGRVKNGYKSQD